MKVSVKSTNAVYGHQCIVSVDGYEVYKSYSHWQEIALWEACNRLKIDTLTAFKSWIPTSDWFAYIDKSTRKNIFVNYLRTKWVYQTRRMFRNEENYLQFVESYHNCIANQVEKAYFSGL
jgi:hypothetical protein